MSEILDRKESRICEEPPMEYAETVMMGSHQQRRLNSQLEIEMSKNNFLDNRKSRRFQSLRVGDKNVKPLNIETNDKSRIMHILTCTDCPSVGARAQVFARSILSKIGEEWIFLLLLGVTMAILSYLMDYAIFQFQAANIKWYNQLRGHLLYQFIVWVVFPVTFIAFATGFVHLVGPNAVGSGIPEMKTIIRGVTLTDYLSFRTLVSKVVGLTISLGSGMPIGKEGPFVHIASMVATLLSKFVTSFQGLYENQTRTTEMLAAACAVGVACNFAAPIGGVLFSIEVTSTFFAVRNYWRGFFGAVVGAFVFQLIGLYAEDERSITALYVTNFAIDEPYNPLEIFIFAFVGIMCGFAGALYVWFHRQVVLFMRKPSIHSLFMKSRFIYPVLVTLFIASVTFPPGLGQFFAADLTSKNQINELFSNFTWTGDSHNQEQDDIIKHWTAPYGGIFMCLACYTLSKFVLSALALTMPVPSGVFIPAFLMGAGYGRLVGECMCFWFPYGFAGYPISAGGYALVGAASMSGSVTHTISTSVIVFELTGQMSHGLPVLISVILANVVAQCLQPSIYDSIIQIKRLPFLPDIVSAGRKFYDVMAEDIMLTNFNYVCYASSFKQMYSVIRDLSSTEVLPLVESEDSMVLLGTVRVNVLQEKINVHIGQAKLLEFTNDGKNWEELSGKAFCSDAGSRPVFSPQNRNTLKVPSGDVSKDNKKLKVKAVNMFSGSLLDISPQDVDNTLTKSCSDLRKEFQSMENLSLNERELLRWEELRMKMPIEFSFNEIDASPFSIVGMTNLPKVHSLFSLLGLREAYVTRMGKLVGIITLTEIRKAVEQSTFIFADRGSRRISQPAQYPKLGHENIDYSPDIMDSTDSDSSGAAAAVVETRDLNPVGIGNDQEASSPVTRRDGRFTSTKVAPDFSVNLDR